MHCLQPTEYRKCIGGGSSSEEDANLKENTETKEEGGDHPNVTEEDLVEMMDFADVRTLSTLRFLLAAAAHYFLLSFIG